MGRTEQWFRSARNTFQYCVTATHFAQRCRYGEVWTERVALVLGAAHKPEAVNTNCKTMFNVYCALNSTFEQFHPQTNEDPLRIFVLCAIGAMMLLQFDFGGRTILTPSIKSIMPISTYPPPCPLPRTKDQSITTAHCHSSVALNSFGNRTRAL